MLHLVEGSSTVDIGEGCKHDNVLQWRDQKVGNEDLEDLGLGGGVAVEDALEEGDEEMAERGRDEGTVGSHLWDTRGEVGSVLWTIFGDDGGEEFLESHERTGSEHFGTKWVVLESLEVDLGIVDTRTTLALGLAVEVLGYGGLDGRFGHFDEVTAGWHRGGCWSHFGDGVHNGGKG